MNHEEQCYTQALTELREKTLHEATFAKAFADGLGDTEKTKALYVKYRATSLIKEMADDEYRNREFKKMAEVAKANNTPMPIRPEDITVPQANKTTAGILAVLFGWIGAHKIYLGKLGPAILTCAIFFIGLLMAGIPSIAIVILSIYEAVCYFNMGDEEFHRKYMVGQQSWF
jgi:TM2 domain-containing membrane protein YozV